MTITKQPSPLALQSPQSPGILHSTTRGSSGPNVTPTPQHLGQPSPASPTRPTKQTPPRPRLQSVYSQTCCSSTPEGTSPGPYRWMWVEGTLGPPGGSQRSSKKKRDSRGGGQMSFDTRKKLSFSGRLAGNLRTDTSPTKLKTHSSLSAERPGGSGLGCARAEVTDNWDREGPEAGCTAGL